MAAFALPLAGDAISAGMSLFNKNGSEGTDRKQELASYGDLGRIGSQQEDAGLQDSGAASRYYQALLSGDPAAIARAMQPGANATAAQAAQQRATMATQGGDRTGGATAGDQQITQNADAETADATAKAQGGAAAPLANMGSQETGKSLQAASELGSEAAGNREESDKIGAEKGAALGSFVSSPEASKFASGVSSFLLGKGGAPTGSAPWSGGYNPTNY